MKKTVLAAALAAVFSISPCVVPEIVPLELTACAAMVDSTESETIQADGYGAAPAGMPAGRAKLMARRAAIVDAQRNLVETIKGTAVDADTTMENFILQSDVVKTKVSGMVTGARVISEDFQPDGSYHVVMAVPMYGVGSVADAAINAVTGGQPPVPVAAPSPSYTPGATTMTTTTASGASTTTTTITTTAPATVQTSAPSMQPVASASSVGGYSGLIIDAKNSGLERTFCPAIFDTNGRAIYGVRNVDPQYAVNYGVAGYAEGAENWSQAESGNSRAGASPLIIKAVGLNVRKTHKCDIVVTPEDGDRILAENQKSHFLDRYAVTLEM